MLQRGAKILRKIQHCEYGAPTLHTTDGTAMTTTVERDVVTFG